MCLTLNPKGFARFYRLRSTDMNTPIRAYKVVKVRGTQHLTLYENMPWNPKGMNVPWPQPALPPVGSLEVSGGALHLFTTRRQAQRAVDERRGLGAVVLTVYVRPCDIVAFGSFQGPADTVNSLCAVRTFHTAVAAKTY